METVTIKSPQEPGDHIKQIPSSVFVTSDACLLGWLQEARCMAKARRLGVLTPTLYAVDPLLHTLTLEYIEGPAVKEVLLGFGSCGVDPKKLGDMAVQMGSAIAKLHDGGLIHGDLTTSNMIVQTGTDRLVRYVS